MEPTRILIVEHESGIAADLGERLKRMAHAVTTTATAEQALEAAERIRPDLVFMDILLPGPVNATETARRMRRERNLPVVYLASDAEAAARHDNSTTEPFGCVLTTFNDRELHAAIEFALYRHRIDAKLLKEERWLSTTLASLGDAVIATDRHGCVALINAVAQRLTGWTEKEAVGRPFNEVFRVISGDSRVPIPDLIERTLAPRLRNEASESVILRTRTGTELPIDESIAAIRDKAKGVTGVVVVFRDSTERKLAEQASAATNQQLEHRIEERTAQLAAAHHALGALSGSVSHDLRAPLRAVSGYSTLLSERYADVLDVEGRRFLEIIQTKSEQMARMIDDFIRLWRLRQTSLRFAPLDLDAMLREVVALLAEEDPGASDIVIDGLPSFEGDEGLIRQVWVNLLSNALKFTSKREHRHIRVSGAEEADGMVQFQVVDNGAGFDMAHAGRLFAPFQRLHFEREFEGHGIGLATVAAVIERHGGHLCAEGQIGSGATFRFFVPKTHAVDASSIPVFRTEEDG